jgi:hypothetical protein
MQGIHIGISGARFMQYLEYYYYYLALRSQRKGVNRPIDDTSMAFLVCVAAFGMPSLYLYLLTLLVFAFLARFHSCFSFFSCLLFVLTSTLFECGYCLLIMLYLVHYWY